MKTSIEDAGPFTPDALEAALRAASARFADGVRHWLVRSAHLRQLERLLEMDEHILRDIGVTRDDVMARAAALRKLL